MVLIISMIILSMNAVMDALVISSRIGSIMNLLMTEASLTRKMDGPAGG